MPAPPDSENGRVTLALLGQDIQHIKKMLDEWMDGNELRDKVLVEHTVRLEQLAGAMATQCQRLDGRVDGVAGEAAKERQRIDGRIDRTEDKVKGWQAGQGVVSVVLAAIAAWFGTRY